MKTIILTEHEVKRLESLFYQLLNDRHWLGSKFLKQVSPTELFELSQIRHKVLRARGKDGSG